MKYLIIIFILVLNLSPAFSQNKKEIDALDKAWGTKTNPDGWKYSTTSNDSSRWFIKTEYVNKTGSKIKLWVKSYDKSTTINKKVYANTETKMLISIDCETNKVSIHAVVIYSKGGKGVVLDQSSTDSPDTQDIVPDSVMDGIKETVCNFYND